jgi:hypothetical protein
MPSFNFLCTEVLSIYLGVGGQEKVIADHHALCWFLKKKDLAGRLARWSLKLQDLDIEIVYRSEKLHSDSEILSRNPVEQPGVTYDIPTVFLLPQERTRSINKSRKTRHDGGQSLRNHVQKRAWLQNDASKINLFFGMGSSSAV